MTIAVTCGSCKTNLRVKDEHAGKRAKCPRCQAVVQIPQPLDELEIIENDPIPFKRPPSQAVVEIPPLLDELEVIDKEPGPLKRPPKRKPQLLKRDILEAFEDDIPPVKRTASYAVGVLFVSIAMLMLPALYILLLAGIAFLLYYHATSNGAAILRVRHWGAFFLFYIGPIVIGVIVLLFMVKPLFTRRARKIKLRTLKFDEEPLLFVLVRRIARAVGAPEPKRIDIDGQVNASASFGSLFGILFGGDLVLTIGLPLVAGLSIEQLAGVIAHELGHFNQGVGMRLSYVVRSINAWFARIVYEGDDWDEALAKTCADTDFRIGFILYLALLCVWLTRVVFWLFMVIGHVLSCFLLRQMEYDADRNEARLVGADVFAETFRNLLVLQLVSNSAYGMASLSWYKKGKVPDDLSALILRLADSVPAKEFRKIKKKMARSEASLFDTHPSDGERLASVRQEDAPGVFHLDGPATQLFTDFHELSRAVTLRFYRAVIGKRVTRDSLVPVGVFLGEEQAAVEKPKRSGERSGDYYDFAP
jgi:Zn-dependent protease with chaperone function